MYTHKERYQNAMMTTKKKKYQSTLEWQGSVHKLTAVSAIG